MIFEPVLSCYKVQKQVQCLLFLFNKKKLKFMKKKQRDRRKNEQTLKSLHGIILPNLYRVMERKRAIKQVFIPGSYDNVLENYQENNI